MDNVLIDGCDERVGERFSNCFVLYVRVGVSVECIDVLELSVHLVTS